MDKLLNEEQVAATLGVSVNTLRKLVEEGEFPFGLKVSEGTAKAWLPKDLERYLYVRSRCLPRKAVKRNTDEPTDP